MNKREFRAHFLMMTSLIRPFLFVLIIPVLKGVLQYLMYRRISGVLTLECVAVSVILLLAFLQYRCFRLVLTENTVEIHYGVLFKRIAVLKLRELSSVSMKQNPAEMLFGAVTYRINTEAGRVGKPDFSFKLSTKDSKELSELLYGGETREPICFPLSKLLLAAATTSSAVTGIIIGVPLLNEAGELLGVALSQMLLNEINEVSNSVRTEFPPVINAVTLCLLAAYTVSFFVSFLRYFNFKLFVGDKKIEVQRGLIVRRSLFRIESINNICIEQSFLLRVFRRFTMYAAVGGYGDRRGEKAILVPCGKKVQLISDFSKVFPFLSTKENKINPLKTKRNCRRFFLLPALLLALTVTGAAILTQGFLYFDNLIIFIALVVLALIFYYAGLCGYNYKYSYISLENGAAAQGTYRFRKKAFFCKKEKIGIIRLRRNPFDRNLGTCKAALYVRSENSDKISLKHLEYKKLQKQIEKQFNIQLDE